jgi:alpha-1,2-glucosyltransferase
MFKSLKNVLAFLFLAFLMTIIIKYNTVIHPYLIADNRHYTFYVWNRLFGRNEFFRFAFIPVYIFGFFVIFKSLRGSIGFKIFFVISTVLTLCLQGLIEVRYFLIPYLILRLSKSTVIKKWTILELAINIAINYVTFEIFFTREVTWKDFEEPQRIIW